MGGANVHCVNNHYANFELKEWILLELQITQTRHPLRIADGKHDQVKHPSKPRVGISGTTAKSRQPLFLRHIRDLSRQWQRHGKAKQR